MHPIDISVIIPTWNRSSVIRRAIESIRGDFTGSFEVIVVDDGSTDGTDRIAREALADAGLNGRVIREANSGPAVARNVGVAASSGRYLAFLDSDDYWFPWTLTLCMKAIKLPRPPALVFLQSVDVRDKMPNLNPSLSPPEFLTFDGFLEAVDAVGSLRYATCNAAMSREVFDTVGGFRRVASSEDTDMFMRAAQLGPCRLVIGPPLVAHELGRGDNISAFYSRIEKGFRFILRENERGAYPQAPGGAALKRRMLDKIIVHTILMAFASGRPREAYRLMFRHGGTLMRAGDWHWLVRLPILPALAWLKPASFTMRWHPRDSVNRS